MSASRSQCCPGRSRYLSPSRICCNCARRESHKRTQVRGTTHKLQLQLHQIRLSFATAQVRANVAVLAPRGDERGEVTNAEVDPAERQHVHVIQLLPDTDLTLQALSTDVSASEDSVFGTTHTQRLLRLTRMRPQNLDGYLPVDSTQAKVTELSRSKPAWCPSRPSTRRGRRPQGRQNCTDAASYCRWCPSSPGLESESEINENRSKRPHTEGPRRSVRVG